MARRVPASGINLFQLIYVLIRDYREQTGRDPLNLSLGNPDGVPPGALRELKAAFARDSGYAYHTYAEDKDLEDFAAGMARLHARIDPRAHPHLAVLPIAGIKTATALMPLACGLRADRRKNLRLVSNLPAYDVIGTWSGYLGVERLPWPLASEDGMRPNLSRLKAARPDLVFTIRPGNPAAVGAKASEWKALIEYCLKKKARLVNDAAYAGLAEPKHHVPLAAVAKDYPALEWLELYSVSKSFSDPGARLGALIGTKDFVEDYRLVKGNTDSGPVPSVMAAYGRFLQNRDVANTALADLRGLYRKRLDYVVARLKSSGLRPACETDAGFFTLWRAPRRAFGFDVARESRARGVGPAEAFNRLVIRETGIIGVHFEGQEPLIRYAVCADVLAPRFQRRFEEGLARLQPEY